jgi:hypothetical protein
LVVKFTRKSEPSDLAPPAPPFLGFCDASEKSEEHAKQLGTFALHSWILCCDASEKSEFFAGSPLATHCFLSWVWLLQEGHTVMATR